MGATSGDSLPWPEANDPANVPQDMHELADAVQAGLNQRIKLTPWIVGIGYAAGWKARGPNVALTMYGDSFVLARGLITPTALKAVADNGQYTVGTIPTQFRPPQDLVVAVGWQALNTAPSPDTRQLMATQMGVNSDGSLVLVSNVVGSMTPDADWVSLGGVAWNVRG